MRSVRHVVASAVVLALASVGMMSSLSGCSGGHFGGSAPLAATPDLQSAGLKLQWHRGVQILPGEEIKKVWRSGSSVYIHTSASRLFSVDARSGAQNWETSLGSGAFELYKPIELPGKPGKEGKTEVQTEVLAVSRGEAYVLDKFNGSVKRSSNLGLAVAADPVIAAGNLCVGGANKFVGIYLDQLVGAHWIIPSTNDFFGSAPVIVNEDVIVASGKGQLWRIDAATGNWMWKDRKTNGQVVAGLAADKRAVYVPCLDHRVYAFTLDAGAELWETQLEGRLDQAAVPAGDAVLVPASGHGLYALDPANGHKKWEVQGIQQIATVVGTTAYVSSADGTIKALSVTDGSEVGSAPAPGVKFVVKNLVDQQVILVNESGMIGSYVQR